MPRFFRYIAFCLLLTALISPIFVLNAVGSAPNHMFTSWQEDSDSLVLGRLQSDLIGFNTSEGYGLLRDARYQGKVLELDGLSAQEILATGPTGYLPDSSLLGFQGDWSSFLYKVGFETRPEQSAVNAVLFSFVLSIFIFVLYKTTNLLFAAIFGLVAVGSPWLVSAAHSSYWITWSWFLPTIFLAGFYFLKTKSIRVAMATLAFLAFVFKFGSGYEFLTSISLLAACFPLISKSLSLNSSNRSWSESWKLAISGFVISVSAFFVVFTRHSFLRGNGNIIEGAKDIIVKDVLRHTALGDPSNYNADFQDALHASAWKVFKTYLFEWKTDFFSIGYGSPLNFIFGLYSPFVLLSLSVFCVVFLAVNHQEIWKKTAILLTIAFVITFSWYELARAHSYAHQHINYVLWYLLLAPVVVYIPVRTVLDKYLEFKKSNQRA